MEVILYMISPLYSTTHRWIPLSVWLCFSLWFFPSNLLLCKFSSKESLLSSLSLLSVLRDILQLLHLLLHPLLDANWTVFWSLFSGFLGTTESRYYYFFRYVCFIIQFSALLIFLLNLYITLVDTFKRSIEKKVMLWPALSQHSTKHVLVIYCDICVMYCVHLRVRHAHIKKN